MLRVISAVAVAVVAIIGYTSALADRDANIRQFEVTLRSKGDNSIRPEMLQFVVAHLADTGTDSEVALAAVMEVLNTPGLNASATDRIVTLARDIAAARRDDLIYWTHRLARAVAGPTAGLIDFIFGLNSNGMTVAEVSEIQRLAAKGDRNAVVNKGMSILNRQFSGAYDALRRR